MYTIRSLATTAVSLLSILHLYDDIAEEKGRNKLAYTKK